MKQTEADRRFALEFGNKLTPLYEREVKAMGALKSPADFAHCLGVSTGALQKYLRGQAMPSLRTVIKAYDEFGILIPYEGRNPSKIVQARGKKRATVPDIQMSLPLIIESPNSEISCELKKKAPGRFRIELQIKQAV